MPSSHLTRTQCDKFVYDFLCSCCAVSPQPPHGNHTEPMRGSAWGLCNATYDRSTAYDFVKFVKLLAKPNRRGRGARESVRKSHSRLLPPQGGLAEAAWGDTGSVDPSQAKCELGITANMIVLKCKLTMDCSSLCIHCRAQSSPGL